MFFCNGGGGGTSAGTAANGNNGAFDGGSQPSAPSGGGAGGQGGQLEGSPSGIAGSAPGGGGGGNSSVGGSGASGAVGKIILTYTAVSNNAPSISAGPSDGGSYSSAPTNAGSNVTFTGTATDTQSDSYYLVICKSNSVTAVNSSAPTCPGGSWAISTSTASGAQASVTYTTLSGDSESNVWYAFVCDNNSASLCSSSSQGSGNNGSPFTVNHVPSFSAVANTSGYIISGNTVTFTATASDTDTDGSADTVQLFVCKANDFSAGACGAGGTWASGSASASNPTAVYTVVSGDSDGSHTYYANVIDSHSFASTSNPRSSSFTTDVTAPTVNAGSDQSVTAAFTTTATASDATSGLNTYQWSKQSGTGNVVFGTDTSLNTVINANNGTYVIRLTVTDLVGNSAYDEFSLTWSTASSSSSNSGQGGASYCLITNCPKTSVPLLASPTPPPTGYFFIRYLGLTDRGQDVMELQKLLKTLGFFPQTQTITSFFGAITKASVKKFQAKYYISQTGNVGPITKKVLNNLQGF